MQIRDFLKLADSPLKSWEDLEHLQKVVETFELVLVEESWTYPLGSPRSFLAFLICMIYQEKQTLGSEEMELIVKLSTHLQLAQVLDEILQKLPELDLNSLNQWVKSVDWSAFKKELHRDLNQLCFSSGSSHRLAQKLKFSILEKVGLSPFGHFCDPRDGQVYKTVEIGEQIWMAENLNYCIAPGAGSWSYGHVFHPKDILAPLNGLFCSNSTPQNRKKYGRLYSEEFSVRACPPGWRLPTKEDWEELIHYVGGEENVGTQLKSATEWDGTDFFGFSALPILKYKDMDHGEVVECQFWGQSDIWAFASGESSLWVEYFNWRCMSSIRCIMD